jgi:hypothetical protein
LSAVVRITERGWGWLADHILLAYADVRPRPWSTIMQRLLEVRPDTTQKAAQARLGRLLEERSRVQARRAPAPRQAPVDEVNAGDWRPARPTLAQKMAGR